LVVLFAFGFGLLAAIFAFGHISGGHFNPAVTVAMVLDRRTTPIDAVGYVVSQIIGAIAAGALVLVAVSQDAVRAGVTKPGGGVSDVGALIIETVATAGFIAVILASTKRAAALAALAIPMTLVAIHFVATPPDPRCSGALAGRRSWAATSPRSDLHQAPGRGRLGWAARRSWTAEARRPSPEGRRPSDPKANFGLRPRRRRGRFHARGSCRRRRSRDARRRQPLRAGLRQPAGGLLTAAHVEQRRLLDRAPVERERAAMEPAAGRDVRGVGCLALEDRPLPNL
jgi:hypothetical protein